MLRAFDVGIQHLAFCDLEGTAIRRWAVDAIPGAAQGLCAALFGHLEAVGDAGLTRVVIEAQSKRSVKLLAVQHWLEAFYTLRGLPVTVYSARHKLSGTGLENSGAGNYRARKRAAVALCAAWLEEHPQAADIRAFFEGCKKKDDAADSLLMAAAYLRAPGHAPGPAAGPVRIVCRRPTLLQQHTGRYSKANVKHLALKEWGCVAVGELEARLAREKRVARAVRRQWPDLAACWAELQVA